MAGTALVSPFYAGKLQDRSKRFGLRLSVQSRTHMQNVQNARGQNDNGLLQRAENAVRALPSLNILILGRTSVRDDQL